MNKWIEISMIASVQHDHTSNATPTRSLVSAEGSLTDHDVNEWIETSMIASVQHYHTSNNTNKITDECRGKNPHGS